MDDAQYNIIDITPVHKYNEKTVAILTNFMDFNPGYSLAGIIVDQAAMLLNQGHRVIIYVNEQYNPKNDEDMGLSDLLIKFGTHIDPEADDEVVQFQIKRKTKFMHLTDYDSIAKLTDDHMKQAQEAGEIYFDEFKKEGVQVAFTHDFIFTGWNLPYSQAIIKTHQLLEQKSIPVMWYHWVHSVPSANRDWWNMANYGDNHFIVFPNQTEITRVAESFRTNPSQVKVIPHIKDIRTWYDFGVDAMGITRDYPNIMKAAVIQVYPCSTDRLSAKQLSIVIQIFGHMKIFAKVPVFLVIANQWATGRARKEDVEKYVTEAESCGLIEGKDFIFTSKCGDEYAKGISKRMLRELQLLSNVFIFPTREESFGLVGPEASFSGALPIMNKSLDMMKEVMGHDAPSFDFGSFHNNTPAINDDGYIRAIALAVLNRVYSNEAIMTKIFTRTRYHMEAVYHRYYLPCL
ncbi:MAG: hypothetical protein PF503_18700 [Desulfobacula sp.]|jgi:hypothetical protein|nr:hypothetical protein [Desulfobacula sp.]